MDVNKRNFNDTMTEKAEAIRCRRFEAIVNKRYDFLDKGRLKGDFLAYYKEQLRYHDQKWEFVYQHFSNFVHGKCSFEEIVDYSVGGKCVHTITQKTQTEDIVPISEEALALIGYSPENTGRAFIGLKHSWTQAPMKKWIKSAGINKNITFHSYRRTFATLQAAAGTDVRTIQSMMAHKSITTTQRYIKVVDNN